MASSLALPDLLDRAGKIFELARDLGWAFQQERQRGGGQFGPHRWHPHAETFKALYGGLVDLRDQMEGPPEGFEAVAKCLKQLIPIVRDLRRIEGRFVRDPDGGVLVFWDYMPRLHEVAHDGYRAIKHAKAQGLDDPFRTFIDDLDQRGNAGGGEVVEPEAALSAGDAPEVAGPEDAPEISTDVPTSAAIKPKPPKADATHGDDFRSVRWFGTEYTFTPMQAGCIKILWEHYERGAAGIGQVELLDQAGSNSERLRDVFAKGKHPAWGTMIVKAGGGIYKLSAPE